MGALGRRHPHVHVRDDLLQLPDSDTLGQGLDILNINSYMMGGHKSESFYAAMLCKWFVVLQTLGLYKVKFIIKFQSCEES